MELVRGTPLSSEDLKHAYSQYYKPKANYAWDTGLAIGKYLAALKEGYLLGIKCTHCKTVRIPPRAFCEQCFKPIHEWVKLPDTGTVNTYSISYITWDAKRVETPTIPAVIDIDGTTPGTGILHIIDEVEPKLVKIGMKVRAVWKPEKEREGAITDIKYWRPIK